MESKLQSLKVAELKALLTSAGLAVSGNKPDLIQRLLENPSATASLGGDAAEAAAAAAAASAPVAAAPPAAAAAVSTATPAPAPTTPVAAPAAPAAAETSNGTHAEAPQPNDEQRRQALIAELEKRKKRAAKFGQPLGEAERKLERAIKFGLDAEDEANVAKLTQPLSSKPAKSVKSAPAKQSAEKPAQAQESKETEQDKQARLAQLEAEREKARKRAERFGLVDEGQAGEAKRKRDDKAVRNGDKKVKA